jgi:F5/8 type C domain/FecR protein
MVLSLGLVLVPLSARAARSGASAPTNALAQVAFIQRSLTVHPPHKKAKQATLQMQLYNAYRLNTGARARASLRFTDGTVLHVNQLSNLTLLNPHTTYVTSGEIDEIVTPGTQHRVQTSSCVAAAIGTEFDVKEVRVKVVEKRKGHKGARRKVRFEKKTVITVVEGALVVDTKKGKVTVKTGQKTEVLPGKKPSRPVKADAKAATTWTSSIPAIENRMENVALDANGGRVAGYSSQYESAAPTPAPAFREQSDARAATIKRWNAAYLIDGRLDLGWASAPGKIKGEYVKVGFNNNQVFNLAGIVLDPNTTQGLAAADDVKDFRIFVSTTDAQNRSFRLIYTGTAVKEGGLQRFVFSNPVPARYVDLVVLDNFGGNQATAAELEVIAAPAPVTLPTSTPVPTPTPTFTSTPTPTFTPTSTPTFTPTPTNTPAFIYITVVTPTPTATCIPRKTYLGVTRDSFGPAAQSLPTPTFTPSPLPSATPTPTTTPFPGQCP